MRIGKEIKKVKAPKREIRKAEPRPERIPVPWPIKKPEKVEAWDMVGRFRFGMDVATKADVSVIHVSGV